MSASRSPFPASLTAASSHSSSLQPSGKSTPDALLGNIVLSSNIQTHAGVFAFKTSPRGGNSFSELHKFDDQTVRLQFTRWQRLVERQAGIAARTTRARK